MIYPGDSFTKHFKKRIAKNTILVNRFQEKIKLLEDDPFHPQLKTHKLVGELKDSWSFSLTNEFRVIFEFRGNDIILIDIGSHDQVY